MPTYNFKVYYDKIMFHLLNQCEINNKKHQILRNIANQKKFIES